MQAIEDNFVIEAEILIKDSLIYNCCIKEHSELPTALTLILMYSLNCLMLLNKNPYILWTILLAAENTVGKYIMSRE